MFNQKPTRTQIAVIAVATMLVLAGCSTGTPATDGDSNPQEPSTIAFTTAEATTDVENERSATEGGHSQTDTPEYGPEPEQNLTEYSDELGEATAGLNSSEREAVESLVVGFYNDLPENESDRRDVFLESADTLCEKDQEFEGDLNVSMLEEGGRTTDDTIRRAHFAAQIANEFDGQVPVEPLGDFRSGTGDVTKYAPLLASYNQMSDAACTASEDRTDAAIQEYQLATLMFGVDAFLILSGAFYRPAFAGTRFTVNKASQLGLYRLRYMCGNRCWALAMSEVHIALRGSMVAGASNLMRQAGKMGVELSREDLAAVADQYDTDVDSMLAGINISNGSDTVDEASDDVMACSDAVLEDGEEESGSDDDGGILDGGIDSDGLVEKGEEALNESVDKAEKCRDAADG